LPLNAPSSRQRRFDADFHFRHYIAMRRRHLHSAPDAAAFCAPPDTLMLACLTYLSFRCRHAALLPLIG